MTFQEYMMLEAPTPEQTRDILVVLRAAKVDRLTHTMADMVLHRFVQGLGHAEVADAYYKVNRRL